MHTSQGVRCAVAIPLVLSLAAPAAAQDVPKSAADAAKATEGKTELTTDKFEAAARRSKDDKDAQELQLSAGGLQSGGNARIFAATAVGKYRLRLGNEQFKAAIAGNYGQAALPGGDWETTVENGQGLARYDHFLGDVTLFIGAQARNDRFQGLDLRLRVDPGVGYYFIDDAEQQLWTELGYDLRYDVRRDDSRTEVDANGAATLLPKTAVLHSGRLFLGYSIAVTDSLSWNAGVEYLQGLSDTTQYSVNGDSSLVTKIRKSLSISLAISERYDAKPLPGKQGLDTTTSVNLVYTLM